VQKKQQIFSVFIKRKHPNPQKWETLTAEFNTLTVATLATPDAAPLGT